MHKSAYIKGKDTASSSKPCYVNVGAKSKKSVYLKGRDIALSSKPVFIKTIIKSSKPAFIKTEGRIYGPAVAQI